MEDQVRAWFSTFHKLHKGAGTPPPTFAALDRDLRDILVAGHGGVPATAVHLSRPRYSSNARASRYLIGVSSEENGSARPFASLAMPLSSDGELRVASMGTTPVAAIEKRVAVGADVDVDCLVGVGTIDPSHDPSTYMPLGQDLVTYRKSSTSTGPAFHVAFRPTFADPHVLVRPVYGMVADGGGGGPAHKLGVDATWAAVRGATDVTLGLSACGEFFTVPWTRNLYHEERVTDVQGAVRVDMPNPACLGPGGVLVAGGLRSSTHAKAHISAHVGMWTSVWETYTQRAVGAVSARLRGSEMVVESGVAFQQDSLRLRLKTIAPVSSSRNRNLEVSASLAYAFSISGGMLSVSVVGAPHDPAAARFSFGVTF